MTTPEQHPQPYPIQHQPIKSRPKLSGGAIAGIIVGVVALLGCGACGVLGLVAASSGTDEKSSGKSKSRNSSSGRVVTYEVSGEGSASITYSADGRGSIEQANNVTLPWSSEQTMHGSFGALSISAQRGSDDAGEITCRIVVNGDEVEKRTSSGSFAVVSCSGSF